MQSAKEKENKKLNEEILQLLSKPTAKVESTCRGFSLIFSGAGILDFMEASYKC